MTPYRIPNHALHPYPAQRGAALFTALIILVVVTVISLGSLGTTMMELRMSSNEESYMQAFQKAQSAIDETITNADQNFVVAGNVGDTFDVTLSNPPFDSSTTVVVTRTSEEGCPPRSSSQASSCDKMHAAAFEANSKFDKAAIGQGQTELVQSYIKLIPVSGQGNPGIPPDSAEN